QLPIIRLLGRAFRESACAAQSGRKWMLVSATDTTGRPAQVPAGGAAPGGGSGPLSQDEWQFLRGTPDYDAEEMASVTLASDTATPPPAADRAKRPVYPTVMAAAGFPEASSLAELVGDLLDVPD